MVGERARSGNDTMFVFILALCWGLWCWVWDGTGIRDMKKIRGFVEFLVVLFYRILVVILSPGALRTAKGSKCVQGQAAGSSNKTRSFIYAQ